MQLLQSITDFIAKILSWWFVVMPWERALRIRKGNIVKHIGAGLYFKIPFIDTVFVQTTRMRMIDTPMQTMTSSDGIALTVKSVIGYTIDDINVLYQKLYHPEITLSSMVMGLVAEHVRSKPISAANPEEIEKDVNEKINSEGLGLKDINVRITTFAAVKTFRLMQDHSGMYEGLNMTPISVSNSNPR